MKKIIRLTENDLRGIIKRSVNSVLREHMEWFNDGQITDDAGYVNSIKKFCENPVDMDNYDPSDDDIYDAIGEFNPDELDTDFSDLMGNNQNESSRRLGRIIRESVNKILSETINELDPRTYASYADKRRAQGQNDKAFQGVQAATNAWNKEFSRDFFNDHDYNDRDTVFMNSYDLRNADGTPFDPEGDRDSYETNLKGNSLYNIQRSYRTPKRVGFDAEYNPHTNMSSGYRANDSEDDLLNMLNKKKSIGDRMFREYPGKVDMKGLDVAKQMAHGNGKYIKGKGWQ